jgi:hypothetical protein
MILAARTAARTNRRGKGQLLSGASDAEAPDQFVQAVR